MPEEKEEETLEQMQATRKEAARLAATKVPTYSGTILLQNERIIEMLELLVEQGEAGV
ncbi:unnamed protein product [marine sediment metagenome]|uniref:Uncharacterized protein n=1 Tax=marine sediment metagenome TaxID=412755 RepID=X1U1E3_9ZZZZ